MLNDIKADFMENFIEGEGKEYKHPRDIFCEVVTCHFSI